jgi:hypothetical protein
MFQRSKQIMDKTNQRKASRMGRKSLKKQQVDRLKELDTIGQYFDPYNENNHQKSVYLTSANKGKKSLINSIGVRYSKIVSNTLMKSASANNTTKNKIKGIPELSNF